MTSSFPHLELNMSADVVDIDCPNCGKSIRSSDTKCPFCCSHLEFYDFSDLEQIANGRPLVESECQPKDEKTRSDVVSKEVGASGPVTDEGVEKKGLFGKFFGRKKK